MYSRLSLLVEYSAKERHETYIHDKLAVVAIADGEGVIGTFLVFTRLALILLNKSLKPREPTLVLHLGLMDIKAKGVPSELRVLLKDYNVIKSGVGGLGEF